ncbi:MAG TPA: adenine deaminase [Deltaproteobacteria bacterium]|nr:adenine deaminase [Deltaproteobacteria bacterium]
MEDSSVRISGNIVDVLGQRIYPGTVIISDGTIADIIHEQGPYKTYIIPGFIDSHIHIESSMLTPVEFARIATVHGTVACVSDPHEIANVLGMDGVKFMIENGELSPFKFFFGAPSCVPATPFETSGARIGPDEVEELLRLDEVKYLSEVMNYPGVLCADPEVMAKVELARKYNKCIDGHAPGLKDDMLKAYVNAGMQTDHETFALDEALQKLKNGMKIQIREGSAARDFDVLHPIIDEYPDLCMFCSDDKHPDDLLRGHINDLVKRAVALGHDLMAVLRCACVNPVRHYGLEVGLLRKGDPADFIVVEDLKSFAVYDTYIGGRKVAHEGRTLLEGVPVEAINVFRTNRKIPEDFHVPAASGMMNVIEAVDGQLITGRIHAQPEVEDGLAVSDTDRDILKMAVVNRYEDTSPAVAFVKNFGLKKGAIATSVAHDSHNIVAVGVTDRDICEAVNLVIGNRGGLAVCRNGVRESLALPIAGLMSNDEAHIVADKYALLDGLAHEFGCQMRSPFLTLSFMALLVIPSLKLSDKGLFDAEKFSFIDLFE